LKGVPVIQAKETGWLADRLSVEVSAGASVEAIGAVYEREFDRFLRVAVAIVGDADVGREAVQEGFARALCHRADFRSDGSLEGWLWRTVVRAALKLRAASSQPESSHALAGREAAANGHRANAELRALIAALPERQRLALFLRYYADLDYRGIAELLGIQPGTVGATLNAAHAAIRSKLEEVST
jgi:RNA polymerase sigma factor (sigma-70 family)